MSGEHNPLLILHLPTTSGRQESGCNCLSVFHGCATFDTFTHRRTCVTLDQENKRAHGLGLGFFCWVEWKMSVLALCSLAEATTFIF